MNLNEKIESGLSTKVKNIMKILEKEHFDAYAVGGCVRDILLGKPCHDEDVTTNATPAQMKKVFQKYGFNVVETGIQHGTITIFSKGDKEGFEITTFRSDGDYTDGRHPDSVIFETEISKDLERRDFTINSMAYSLSKGFTSSYTERDSIKIDGLNDLENKTIRAVGNASKRIEEDYLRMLRAVRFASKYGFEIDDELKDAIKFNAKNILNVSRERIRDELVKSIDNGNVDYFRKLEEVGLLKEILPELHSCVGFEQFSDWHNLDVFEHSLKSMTQLSSREEKIAMLLHDIGKVTKKSYIVGIDFNEIKDFCNGKENHLKLLRTFEENQTLENFNNLFNSIKIDGFTSDKELKIKTFRKNGIDYVASNFHNHPEDSAIMSKNILKRLKFSNDEIKEIIPLIEHHDMLITCTTQKGMKKSLIDFIIDHQDLANEKFFEKIMNIKEADNYAQNQELSMDTQRIELRKLMSKTIKELLNGPHTFKDLAVDGNDLMQLGLKGKEIQEAKIFLLREVLRDNTLNEKRTLLNMINIENAKDVFKLSEISSYLSDLRNSIDKDDKIQDKEESFLKEAKNNLPNQVLKDKEFIIELIEEGFPEIVKISKGKIQRDEQIQQLVKEKENLDIEV